MLPTGVIGPQSVAFDLGGEGPYVTVVDEYFYCTLETTENNCWTKELCDGTNDLDLGPICGRPLALSFDYRTSDIYITDAFFGLLVVGFNGGLATQLSSGYKYLSGIDVESYSRHVYMTDASLTYDIRNITQPGFTPDSTGRLLKYDPYNQTVTVLLSGLSGVGGPTANIHRDCILVPESVNKTIIRTKELCDGTNDLDLGPICGRPLALSFDYRTSDIYITDAFFGLLVRAATDGEYWVATSVLDVQKGIRVNESATMPETVSFTEFGNMTITVVQEKNNALYVGSSHAEFVGNYTN
uniref:Protein strictosidine synthase-like 11-like n=1 Tax=Tanacetum cinerariifolium TaxID=118510 RepID=A0A6L2NY51_TANCI|nr:protein strictosidine synthase-like 11-like [Tanacetum cinerariifolium]